MTKTIDAESLRIDPDTMEQWLKETNAETKRKRATWFTKIPDAKLDAVLKLGPPACMLYLILVRENRRHRGRSFVLPSVALVAMRGLRRMNLHRTLSRLEQNGLIRATRRPPKPPLITVLQPPT